MGDLIGACNSSHSGKGLISKGAGLTEKKERERHFRLKKPEKQTSSSLFHLYICVRAGQSQNTAKASESCICNKLMPDWPMTMKLK